MDTARKTLLPGGQYLVVFLFESCCRSLSGFWLMLEFGRLFDLKFSSSHIGLSVIQIPLNLTALQISVDYYYKCYRRCYMYILLMFTNLEEKTTQMRFRLSLISCTDPFVLKTN